jgi:hypothetical protein
VRLLLQHYAPAASPTDGAAAGSADRYGFGQPASACACAEAGTVALTTSWHTCAEAFFRPAASPLPALSQIDMSCGFMLAGMFGWALTLCLHSATA